MLIRRMLSPSEVFEMVKEAWEVLIFIHGGTGSVNSQCHWWRAATKHTHLAHLEVNESGHVIWTRRLCVTKLYTELLTHTVQLSLLQFRIYHCLWDCCVTCNLFIYSIDVLTWHSWIHYMVCWVVKC